MLFGSMTKVNVTVHSLIALVRQGGGKKNGTLLQVNLMYPQFIEKGATERSPFLLGSK